MQMSIEILTKQFFADKLKQKRVKLNYDLKIKQLYTLICFDLTLKN